MPTNYQHPVSGEMLQKAPFFGLLATEIDISIQDLGWPRFRAEQVRQWVYQQGLLDPAKMTNLTAKQRETLAEKFVFGSASVVSHQVSSDGTQKLLLSWPSAKDAAPAVAETVLIPDGPRRTACVSSQVGCPVGCTFCASGINGVKGNLSADQIVEQIIRLNALLRSSDQHVTNVVFMGMGEPLANYANVMKAVRVLHDPAGLNIGARKITISTVGVPAKMRELADEDLPLNLAISLHAPNEQLRRKLIPWAEHFSLPDILAAARFYFEKTGREITLEYILLAGVNDQPQQAKQLATLCKTLRANVNLIRYNEVDGMAFNRPSAGDVVRFQEILRTGGVNAHVRRSRGRDIDAACGQLRRKQQDKIEPVVAVGLP
jgi:23S rRNA (adenine2503-C2)-methyltransferase